MNYPQVEQPHSCSLSVFSLGGSGGSAALSVSVLYLSCQMSKCSQTTSAVSCSSLRLNGPIVYKTPNRALVYASNSKEASQPPLCLKFAHLSLSVQFRGEIVFVGMDGEIYLHLLVLPDGWPV